ncbi:unnamed protein product [Rotaria magnacalcarata]|uniref:N-terminal Ras-GEF domain-containing protein n=1 Tax=Rotaria magnacalcarata TaxID=392030 RepID=A0A8S3F2E5_9BILA|nr:unnamed protein product [Rotaria magnacalcarata]
MSRQAHKTVPRYLIFKENINQATKEKLLDLLVDARQLFDDPSFVEDFLLTYRTFIKDPIIIANKLFDYLLDSNDPTSSEHIARVVLSWVNNHYSDFESNPKLSEFLEKFDDYLQHRVPECMRSWRHTFNLICYTKSSIRTITITRSTRDDILNFEILGGSDTLANNGIFVSKIERHSKVYEVGLRRGDQVN